MQNGDVVVYKNAEIQELMGFAYRFYENETKILWNVGLTEWNDIDDLEILDMTKKENIELFFYNFAKSNKALVATSFSDYIDWVCTYNGYYTDCEEEFIFGENEYKRVMFLSYSNQKIIDTKFFRKYTKVYTKGKFLIYSTEATGFYYGDRVYYFVDTATNKVYFIGLTKDYDSYCNKSYRKLKENINRYYYEIETPDHIKQQDIQNYKDLFNFLYADNNNIISEKQVKYISDLMNHLHKSLTKENKYLDKFIYNPNLKMYLLGTTKLFKEANNYIEIQNSIIVLKNLVDILKNLKKFKEMYKDNWENEFNKYIKELREFYII